MRFAPRISARAWLLVALVALGFAGWAALQRARRVEQVTNTDHEEAVIDPASPTGYAGGKRWLIVPEHNNRSYQWIAETQQMLAQPGWRVRHVDSENAPFGRPVYASSLYRGWLALLACADHAGSSRSLGLSVERAALWADPLLQLLWLALTIAYIARRFHPGAAALFAAGAAAIYPFAGSFLPGVPDEHGLARACAVWSVLPLLATVSAPREARAGLRAFVLAGCAGGLGLWVSAATAAPVVAGVALGGLLATGIRGQAAPALARPWRAWSLAGAATSLAAYLLEYFPHAMELRPEVNHPLYALAWLGLGELLTQADAWRATGKIPAKRAWPVAALAVAAIAALPVVMVRQGVRALLDGDLAASRLTSLPNGVVAMNLPTWLHRDGVTAVAAATLLPLLLLVPAGWLLARRKDATGPRAALALALGPVLVALPFAWRQLAWWNTADALLLVLAVAISAALADAAWRRLWYVGALLVLVSGVPLLLPPKSGANLELTRLEVEGLIERALAHWIADHAGPGNAVVLLPPDRTASWCFHGGLRGIGTADWENRDGLAAAVRIVTATTAEEAQGLINQRGITHLVLPSWDTDLDAFARWSLKNPEDGFIMALHHWALPPWLRARPYPLPVVPGFEHQSVVILEVTVDTNRAAALSRLVEYFLETRQPDLAIASIPGLQRYPADLGALVALAQVEKARGGADDFARAFTALVGAVTSGLDRTLAWDRRVSLAIVLAQGGRHDLAKEQVRRALERLDEARVRSLTTGALFRLQVLAKAYDLPLTDPKARDLARKLLPPELRARL